MNAPLKAIDGQGNARLEATMRDIGRDARLAAHALALAPAAQKNRALAAMAKAIRSSQAAVLAANREDLAEAKAAGATAAFLDRLTLDPARVEAMAAGLEVIRKLKDPVGTIMASWRRPNGMRIERVRVPLGVVGVIYESRPNVTADAGALCLKAGNAAILRGGSESLRSAQAIHAAMVAGLLDAGLPAAAISLVPTRDRAAVGMMLAGLDGALDVIVPRGGKDLVARVQMEARVPVFAHLEGVCHVYVDGKAKLPMAKAIVLNAKMRRTGVCGKDAQAAYRHADRSRLRDPRRRRGPSGRQPGQAGERDRLEHRISRRYHHRRRGRWRRCGDRSYRALWLASHRRDRHRGQSRGGKIPARSGFGDRATQCIDAIRRRRRV